jgi:hypothetical protein
MEKVTERLIQHYHNRDLAGAAALLHESGYDENPSTETKRLRIGYASTWLEMGPTVTAEDWAKVFFLSMAFHDHESPDVLVLAELLREPLATGHQILSTLYARYVDQA